METTFEIAKLLAAIPLFKDLSEKAWLSNFINNVVIHKSNIIEKM